MGQKWVKNAFFQKRSRSSPDAQTNFLAHFEPVLMEFSPFHHMYAPRCTLEPYGGAT